MNILDTIATVLRTITAVTVAYWAIVGLALIVFAVQTEAAGFKPPWQVWLAAFASLFLAALIFLKYLEEQVISDFQKPSS